MNLWRKQLMKFNHNKKRNTAFIYETLILEFSKAVMHKRAERKEQIMSLLKEYFTRGSLLKEELEIYKSFDNLEEINQQLVEKIILEAKKQFSSIDRKKIFDTQTKLISKINKNLGHDVWNNFVFEYKKMATINQVLSQTAGPKKQVMIEKKLLDNLLPKKEKVETFPIVNNLAVKNFVKRFNKEYTGSLNESQKVFLNKYIMSSRDDGLEFKIYLYEEIERLKDILQEQVKRADKNTSDKLRKVVDKMSTYNKRKIDKSFVSEIIKIQSLTEEIKIDGH